MRVNWRHLCFCRKMVLVFIEIMSYNIYIYIYMTLDHKTSHKYNGYIFSNSQKYIVWVKIMNFSLMPKIIRISSKDHVPFCKFPTVNISKLNFLLVICIAKNCIWTNLKVIFPIFLYICTLRFQIFK